MLNELKKILPEERIKINAAMSEYTTFRCGGAASLLVEPESEEEISALVKLFSDTGFIVIGRGSNTLVKDEGIDIPVIYLGAAFSETKCEGETITAKAGATLPHIAHVAHKNSLTGFEFAAGIPGSAGGALAMNAGAYGGEMKDIVAAARYVDENGEAKSAGVDELELSYRKSMFTHSRAIVTEVTYRLQKGEKSDIIAKMNELAAKRRDKQPLEQPSAGSTFKRPAGHFAGALIEEAGLKGCRVGGAMVSPKHAGFIVNAHRATADDVLRLIDYVKERVKENSGVELECEIKIIGKDGAE